MANDPKIAGGVFVNVQYLRAIAALMVVFQHSQFIHRPAWAGLFGDLGVDLFFAISGFVIFATTLKNFSLGNYLLKRCIRIIPLYWGFTFVMAALVLGAPRLFSSTVFTWDHLIQSLLFIPHYTPSRPDEITPLLPPGWTLNYEMFFYFTFGGFLFALRNRALAVAGITLVFLALILGGFLFSSTNAVVMTFTSWRLLEFLAGVFAAYVLLYQPRLRVNTAIAAAVMVLGWTALVGVGFFDGGRTLTVLGIFAVVLGAAMLDRNGRAYPFPLLERLGDASYSIYLFHIFILGALKQLLNRFFVVNDSLFQTITFMSACLLASAVAGLLIYRYIEVPVLDFLRRTFIKPESRAMQPLPSSS